MTATRPKAITDLGSIQALLTQFRAGAPVPCPVEPVGKIYLAVCEGDVPVYRFGCSHCAWITMLFVATAAGVCRCNQSESLPPRPHWVKKFSEPPPPRTGEPAAITAELPPSYNPAARDRRIADLLASLRPLRAPTFLDPEKDEARGPPSAPADSVEKRAILDALSKTAGNQTRAARLLGLSRNAFLKKLDLHQVPRPRRRVERPR